jgi:hypothetical protein
MALIFRCLIFIQKAENLRRDGRGLEHPGRLRSRWLDLKGKGMEGETGKALLLAEELDGPGSAISRVSYHGMAGKTGVAPNLMLAASHKVALNEGIMDAPAKNPEAGLARDPSARAFGMEAASCMR